MDLVASIVVAYLVGSVSFAIVASKLFGLPHPHTYGSGNPGATNVLRTGNKAAAVLTLIGDAAKGALVVLVVARFVDAQLVGPLALPAAALAVFLGHLYPIFHGFRGGKGVATAAGIVLALHWPLGVLLLLVWLALVLSFRISSLGALAAALVAPAGAFYVFGNAATAWAMVPIAALLIWRHRANIDNLVHGRERPIGR